VSKISPSPPLPSDQRPANVPTDNMPSSSPLAYLPDNPGLDLAGGHFSTPPQVTESMVSHSPSLAGHVEVGVEATRLSQRPSSPISPPLPPSYQIPMSSLSLSPSDHGDDSKSPPPMVSTIHPSSMVPLASGDDGGGGPMSFSPDFSAGLLSSPSERAESVIRVPDSICGPSCPYFIGTPSVPHPSNLSAPSSGVVEEKEGKEERGKEEEEEGKGEKEERLPYATPQKVRNQRRKRLNSDSDLSAHALKRITVTKYEVITSECYTTPSSATASVCVSSPPSDRFSPTLSLPPIMLPRHNFLPSRHRLRKPVAADEFFHFASEELVSMMPYFYRNYIPPMGLLDPSLLV